MGEATGGSRRRRQQPRSDTERLPKNIDRIKGGSLRVRVYAGKDTVTGRDRFLTEIIEDGPDALSKAEKARTRLKDQLKSNRYARTDASVSELIAKSLELRELGDNTRYTNERYVAKHVEAKAVAPFLGHLKARSVTTEGAEEFYAELRRCRDHCDGRPHIRHYTAREHKCTNRCRKHVCKPLAARTIRKIHFLLTGAYKDGVRWGWVTDNPFEPARKPASPGSDPQPPTADESAEIINEAWARDPAFGALVWVAMTSGARRGELCALKWRNVRVRHLAMGEHDCAETGCEWSLVIRASIGQCNSKTWYKPTKANQVREIALDAETVAVLMDHRRRCETIAAASGYRITQDSFIFSKDLDGSTWLKPSSLTQRYRRFVTTLRIKTTIHKLRHYSATELILAGVDIRTVAGRLGHGSGGAITLRTYSAFVSLADQRAAKTLVGRMPARPSAPSSPQERLLLDPRSPYEEVAAALLADIRAGVIPADEFLPPVTALAKDHGVAVGTAHRAVALLREWGHVEVSRGRRAIVRLVEADSTPQPSPEANPVAEVQAGPESSGDTSAADRASAAQAQGSSRLLTLEVIHLGQKVRELSSHADPTDGAALERMLTRAIRRHGGVWEDYELDVKDPSTGELITTFMLSTPPEPTPSHQPRDVIKAVS